MQLSTLALLSFFSITTVRAAPLLLTITDIAYTTVTIEGETQNISAAPATTTVSPATATAANTSATTTVSVSNDNLMLQAVVSSISTTSAAETTSSTSIATSTTSAAATSTTTTSTSSGFQSEILAEHNAKRALHGVSALTWDSTLEAYAQDYADKYDCSGTLVHSGGPYGENLAEGYTASGAVDAWYNEGANYDYGSTCSVYDHFTQVIWKSTTKVGCGYKDCGSYWGTYIICSYDPAGNYVGECDENVLPLV